MFKSVNDLEPGLASLYIEKENLPWEAAFLAGQAFLKYRKHHKGKKISPMPDFYIGAHAQVTQKAIITRDTKRYKTYFPKVTLICPEE